MQYDLKIKGVPQNLLSFLSFSSSSHFHCALNRAAFVDYKKVREASELKNVTKSGKSPKGGGEGSGKKSKSPKFEILTF